jgi:hypothetical protein
MSENIQRSRGRPQNYKFDRGGMPAEMGPFIGIVVNNIDTTRQGRLQVYIEQFGADKKNGTPDLFICGHSHITLVQMDKKLNMLWMNPGACGYKGFHAVKTILRFSITGDKIHDLELIELGKRA